MVNTAVCPFCHHRWTARSTARSTAPWLTCSRCQRKHKRGDVTPRALGPAVVYPGRARCQVCDELAGALAPAAVGDEPVLACARCVGRHPQE